PLCGNGIDDDGDGAIDFPADTGCTAASDDSEATADPASCAGVTYEQLPADGMVMSTLPEGGAGQLQSPTCGGAGVAKVYELYVAHASGMLGNPGLVGTGIDTVLYVRTSCTDAASELGCNDDASSDVHGSTLDVALDPGFYYLVVDGHDATSTGAFQLSVVFF